MVGPRGRGSPSPITTHPQPLPFQGGERDKMNDALTPKAIVAALDAHIIGQPDAKRAVAVALRNRWRRQQLRRRPARRGDAQEHPDDRPDRLRQDRDQPPAGEARRRAVREGRGDQVHRGRLCRPRRRADRPRPGRGGDPAGKGTPPRTRSKDKAEEAAMARLLDALTGKGLERGDPRGLPPALPRRPSRPDRDRDRAGGRAADAVRHPRRRRADDQPRRDDEGLRPARSSSAAS